MAADSLLQLLNEFSADVHPLCQPIATSHCRLTPEDRAQRGISDGLLRLSVGLEDTGDLIADLEQALDSLAN
ncbi:PLP-dependent transferase [Marinobacter sp. LV10R510-11A]|uniref:PLP-dependent transferase n=1 Tax=Marinobacter sp. LV10R510-11A TaxID=1415568 RepID=UPI00267CDF29